MSAFHRALHPDDLPMPDGQVMQLVQYCSNTDVEIDRLAGMIAGNPALTAKILRLVNSAAFGRAREISSLNEATVTIGLTSLRSVVLCFAVREALTSAAVEGLDVDLFWEDSVRRGVAARTISQLVGGAQDESFTTGLLLDCGLLVLFMRELAKRNRWPLLRANDPDRRREMETALFGTTHDEVGAQLLTQWELPASYVQSVERHHTPEPGSDECVMQLADWCNAVYTCHDKPAALGRARELAAALGVSNEALEELLAALPGQVQSASEALEVCVSDQSDFEEVMERANRRLLEDNLSYQELTWQLQASLRERDEYADRLDRELAIAREIQQGLQPDTHLLANVAAFNLPAGQLSGDFYDYFERTDGTICFCLGDVSGKGAYAALLMAKTISLFRCLCKVDDDASEILHLMNTELCDNTSRGLFVTFVGGWLDPKANRLRVINAGHLPPLLFGGEGIKQVDASGPPLGIVAGTTYAPVSIPFTASKLYLYTDGLTEGRLDTGDELGVNGFVRWIAQSRALPVDEQLQFIRQHFEQVVETQNDDLTLMILGSCD